VSGATGRNVRELLEEAWKVLSMDEEERLAGKAK